MCVYICLYHKKITHFSRNIVAFMIWFSSVRVKCIFMREEKALGDYFKNVISCENYISSFHFPIAGW